MLMVVGALYPATSLGALPSSRLPKLSFPPSVEVTEISPDLIRNGMPMRIYGFRSNHRIEDVMTDMQHYLEERHFVVGKVMALGELKTLGVSDQKHFINIQGQRVRHGQSSAGFVVITPRPDLYEPKMTTPSIPLPDDVDLLSHELYRDGDRMGEAVLAISPQRARYVGNALVTGFEDAGWGAAPNEMKITSDTIAVYRVLTKGDRVCRLIAMDQTIDGKTIATIDVTCHN
ncbi:MAG TPA: hypothetical protein ENH62_11705 [Marinobacter sp.]|uniref:hypothetical protein n=1 Tax=Marinobacter antarcticus TaxID=564117 RepID=UPI001753F048|nr:hypothetical protein [Marinobacter antarcticus]HDZ38933.1 hypothetical protein [Marinobacter sp.]